MPWATLHFESNEFFVGTDEGPFAGGTCERFAWRNGGHDFRLGLNFASLDTTWGVRSNKTAFGRYTEILGLLGTLESNPRLPVLTEFCTESTAYLMLFGERQAEITISWDPVIFQVATAAAAARAKLTFAVSFGIGNRPGVAWPTAEDLLAGEPTFSTGTVSVRFDVGRSAPSEGGKP